MAGKGNNGLAEKPTQAAKAGKFIIGWGYDRSTAGLPPTKSLKGNKRPHSTLSDTEGEIEHVETVEREKALAAEPVRPQGKFKRHMNRYWCCYTLATIIVLAIFLPILFIVIVPVLAQDIVNSANLPIYQASILNPTPDEVTVSLVTSLKIPAGLKVRMDAVAFDLFNRDVSPIVPYVRLQLPSMELQGTTIIRVDNTTTPILNQEQYELFLSKFIYSKEFTMSIRGSTTCYLGALQAKVTFDKDITLNGLDGLNGFSLSSARLLIPAEADGTNMQSLLNLPNPSVMTFALGNVTFNLMSDTLPLGLALIENVIAVPGNNSINMKGTVDLKSIINNLPELLKQQAAALQQGDLALTASGNKTVYGGVQIPYMESVLDNLKLTTDLPVLELIANTLKGILAEGGIPGGITGLLNDTGLNPNVSDVVRQPDLLNRSPKEV